MTDLADVLALTPSGTDSWTASLPPDWLQGRTAYGGLVAGWAVSACASRIDTGRPVRTLDVAFVAPIPAGPVSVRLTPLAEGGSMSSLSVDVHREDGALGARVLVTCGASRDSDVVVSDGLVPWAPVGDPGAAGVDFPYLPGMTPEFIQHLEIRWCGESIPFTGTGPDGARLGAWIRHRSPATGIAALATLLDANPPTVLPMMPTPRNASTSRWGVHLVRSLPDEASADWFWFEAETVHAAQGYALETLRVFHDRALVAWSEQLVAVFDKSSRNRQA